MESFEITVNGIPREEYYEVCQESGRRLYRLMGAGMLILCVALLLSARRFTLPAILVPLGIYIAIVLGYNIFTRLNYKDQLAHMDPPMEYTFNDAQWTLQMGDTGAQILWVATPKLRKTKLCLFLYNNEVSANMVPLRLLSEEQLQAITLCFEGSRQASKAYLKEQEKKRRQEFRDSHPGLRLGRTGPAWGPWKRR